MLAIAAAHLGLKAHIFCPDPEAPAFHVAAAHTIADYTDARAMAAFAASVSVITFEFENVPTDPLAGHAALCRPHPSALAAAQDRLAEKATLARFAPVAPHAKVDRAEDIAAAIDALRTHPEDAFILKTRRFGYDGKGQVAVDPTDPAAAFEAVGRAPAILEKRVAFAGECSTVLVRGADGATAAYEPPDNVHEDGILRISTVPGRVPGDLAADAEARAARLAESLSFVGVLTVEWFVPADGGPLIANEMAPRVHNSGHWTMDGAVTSQFENHVRAVAGWPLGSTARIAGVTMENLIGTDGADRLAELGKPGTRLYLYGKGVARAGRKMGHINHVRRCPPA